MTGIALDGEDLALRALARNATRIRMTIGGVAIIAGLAVGLLAYWVLRAVSFDVLGVNPYPVTAAVAYGIPCGMALLLARVISRLLIRARQEAWIAELAQQHGVPADRLRDATAIW
jgi:hypothetical protein